MPVSPEPTPFKFTKFGSKWWPRPRIRKASNALDSKHALIQLVLSEGGPTLTTFFFIVICLVYEGREDPNANIRGAIIGLPAQRHLNGVSLACRWWPNIKFWLGSFVIFQEIRTSIAKKPYNFVIFQGGVRPLALPPSGSAHAMSTKLSSVGSVFSWRGLFELRIPSANDVS